MAWSLFARHDLVGFEAEIGHLIAFMAAGLPGRMRRRLAALPMKNRLKVLRAGRDWTQADLAVALEVSRQTVNAIETGKYDPSLPLAFRLARLFGLSIEDIFQDQAEV